MEIALHWIYHVIHPLSVFLIKSSLYSLVLAMILKFLLQYNLALSMTTTSFQMQLLYNFYNYMLFLACNKSRITAVMRVGSPF